MSFSATEAAFEGFRLARRNPMTIVWWSLAYIAFFAIALAAGGPSIANLMAVMEGLENNTDPSMQDFESIGRAYGLMAAWGLPLSLVLGTVLNAAVARAVVRPRESAFGYMRLGMDEVRVFVVTLVLTILFGLIMVLLFGAIGLLVGYTTASGQNALWLAVVLAGLGAFVLMIWLAIRLSLAIPITVAERRIAIFDSFGLTKGKGWPIFGMAVIAFIMSIVVSILGAVVGMPITLMTGGLEALAGMEGASLQEIVQATWPALLAWGVVNAILSALQLAVMYAPFSAAYNGLKGTSEA